MRDLALDSPLVLCLLVMVFGAVSSLMPFSPAEPVLVGVAAVAPTWLLVPLVLLATASHMSTKTLVFLGGRKVENVFGKRNRERFERARARLDGRADLQRSTLFVSSVTGLPPFYLTTALCGTLKMPLRHFLVLAGAGRGIRFAALIFAPQLFGATTLGAQASPSQPFAVTVRGQGPETYVLISGMVGGVAGYRRIEERLVAQGHRVVSIDPYQLSIDARDVSLDALARRVDAVLNTHGIAQAHVVGHAQGGGVALRLAALRNTRATELVLLNVGALPSNKGAVFSSSMRLVPMITRLPFGRDFVRGRFIDGLKDNSASHAWLDRATARAYTEPVLDNIDRVVAMAERLSKAEEPEAVASVVARITVPVTVILGEARRPASATADEMLALQAIGRLLRVEVVPRAGHFLHEENPDEVVRLISGSRVSFASNNGGSR